MGYPEQYCKGGGAHLLGPITLAAISKHELWSGRAPLSRVALVAVGMEWGLGVPLWLLGGGKRGSLVDEIIMRGNDLIFCFPRCALRS